MMQLWNWWRGASDPRHSYQSGFNLKRWLIGVELHTGPTLRSFMVHVGPFWASYNRHKVDNKCGR